MSDWEDDPMVAEALKTREARDVALLACPDCDRYSYYNQGASFYCRFCDRGYMAMTHQEIADALEDDDLPPDCACCSEIVTVADLIDAAAFEAEYP